MNDVSLKDLKPADAEKDEDLEKASFQEITLYHCSDEDGTLKVTEVKTGPLSQSDLTSDDAYIVDNGPSGE